MDKIATIAKSLKKEEPIAVALRKDHYYIFRHGVYAPHWKKREEDVDPKREEEKRLRDDIARANVKLRESEVSISDSATKLVAVSLFKGRDYLYCNTISPLTHYSHHLGLERRQREDHSAAIFSERT